MNAEVSGEVHAGLTTRNGNLLTLIGRDSSLVIAGLWNGRCKLQ